MQDGPDDPLRHLHDRVVQGDRPAIEELTAVLLRDVSGALGRSLPGVDSHVVSDAVEDAILEYLRRPTRFDPSRGELVKFIRMVAYRLPGYMAQLRTCPCNPVGSDVPGANGPSSDSGHRRPTSEHR